jgi:hypothetical protein
MGLFSWCGGPAFPNARISMNFVSASSSSNVPSCLFLHDGHTFAHVPHAAMFAGALYAASRSSMTGRSGCPWM